MSSFEYEYDLQWFCKNVRSIFVRNLVPNERSTITTKPLSPSLQIFIEKIAHDNLQENNHQVIVYDGKEVSYTDNPSWTVITTPLEKILEYHAYHDHSNELISNESNLILEYSLNLYLIKQLRSISLIDLTSLPINSIFFNTNDGLYTIDEVYNAIQSSITSSTNHESFASIDSVDTDSNESFNTSDSNFLIYNADITKELKIMCDLRNEALYSLEKIKPLINDTKKAIMKVQNNKLREHVEEAEREVERERLEVECMRALAMNPGSGSGSGDMTSLVSTCKDLSKDIVRLKQECNTQHDDVLRSQFLLEARQFKLLHDLQALYSLRQGFHGEYTLAGLDLPFDLSSRDDEHISSVLGYISHIILLCSKYLRIPLRYQLIYQSSRSMIRDPAVGNGTALPLYRVRGSDKERLERAVSWLLRNLEQLLRSRGKPYDPKKEMVERDIIAKADCTNASTNITLELCLLTQQYILHYVS
eukprot:gene8008-16393_t